MISRLSGRIVGVTPPTAVIDLGGIGYDVMCTGHTLSSLEARIGGDVTLFTFHYMEGNLAGSNLMPRLVGFLDPRDRGFFNLLTSIKGISIRKALKTMAVPTTQLAIAIAERNDRLLTSLPEIGKKTAAQIIDELGEKMGPYLTSSTVGAVREMSPLNDVQRVALEVLVGWGDRRADAQRWISDAVAADPSLSEPDAIVRAAYRVKQGG